MGSVAISSASVITIPLGMDDRASRDGHGLSGGDGHAVQHNVRNHWCQPSVREITCGVGAGSVIMALAAAADSLALVSGNVWPKSKVSTPAAAAPHGSASASAARMLLEPSLI